MYKEPGYFPEVRYKNQLHDAWQKPREVTQLATKALPLEKTNVHYCVHQISSLGHIESQINPTSL